MKFIKALTLSLGAINLPVITQYQIGLTIHKLYKEKSYKGENIDRLQKKYADKEELIKYRDELLEQGVLQPYERGLPPTIYSLVGRSTNPVEDIVCTVDPFAYISHLSAMSHHGLTNRIPINLYISSPTNKKWKENALAQMGKDLGSELSIYRQNGLPLLHHPSFEKVDKTNIERFSSVHWDWGAYKNIRRRHMRVSTIGRTFLDMLRNPNLCGGIAHVLEVYDNYAETYLRLITDEISQHGKPVDKVRAGYILDERLDIKDVTVDSWVQYAQRGGSRKLDASEEYIPKWSDKWCLSLNVFE